MLLAPFGTYAIGAFVLVQLLRPVLRRVGFDHVVSNPPLVMVSLYVLVLAALVVLV